MSEERPFFSVIVTEHNSAEYMREGLDSIRDQSFTDYELIIVCDKCNTEAEMEIAYEYADTLIKTNYGKAGLARNAGLDAATGEWVLFMDDDDHFMTDAFSEIAEELKRQPGVDILAFWFEWKGMGIGKQSCFRVYPAVWNKAWRRTFIGKNRFPAWSHTEDLFFARTMHPKAVFGFLDKPLYYYNFMREGSITDRIRKGELDNSEVDASCKGAAEGYEKWLKSKEFKE